MRNRLFFPLVALIAVAMVALALNWPEGEAGRGMTSPPAAESGAPN